MIGPAASAPEVRKRDRPPAAWRQRLVTEHTLDDLGNAARLQEHFGVGHIRCLNVDNRKCEWIAWDERAERWVRGEDANARLHAASTELEARIRAEMDLHAAMPPDLPADLDRESPDGARLAQAHEEAVARHRAWRTFWKRSRNVGMQGAARTQLRTLGGVWLAESSLDDPDRTAHLVGLADGVYDLRSGERVENAPGYYITRHAAVAPDPTMPTPAWDETLRNLAGSVDPDGTAVLDPERLAFIERAVGISMFGNPARHVYVLDGPSGTVKSTFTSALQHAAGALACTLPVQTLCGRGSGGSEGPTPFTAGLHGRRFAFSQEATGGLAWNSGMIKALTSGERFPARGLYGNPFDFVNTADLWLTTNEKPRVPDADPATLSRISVFPCDGPIFPRPADFDSGNPKHRPRDATYELRLRREAPGILARILGYAQAAHAAGFELPRCRAVEAARSEYRDDSRSPVERFVHETLRPATADRGLLCPDVYARFAGWFQRNCGAGRDIPPQEVVNKEIGAIFRQHGRAGGIFNGVESAKRVRDGQGGFARRWAGIAWR